MTQLDPITLSSVPSSHGLTPLHIAVLANDYRKVRKIASDREHGLEARTATGSTAYMLAALYGRTDIFLLLNLKKASPYKKDIQGNNALDYVKHESPFVKDLVQEYKKIAATKPDRDSRRLIYGVLKARQRDGKIGYAQGRTDAGAGAGTESQAQAQAQAQSQIQTSVSPVQVNTQQPLPDSSVRLVFLRSLDGKQQEVGEFRQVAAAEHFDIGRKCTGFIRAADGNDSHKFAISGWGRAEDKKAVLRNVLNNKDYTELVIRVAALLGFELEGNRFDEVSVHRTIGDECTD